VIQGIGSGAARDAAGVSSEIIFGAVINARKHLFTEKTSRCRWPPAFAWCWRPMTRRIGINLTVVAGTQRRYQTGYLESDANASLDGADRHHHLGPMLLEPGGVFGIANAPPRHDRHRMADSQLALLHPGSPAITSSNSTSTISTS